MPALANIVVKKKDGTTDVTYTAIQGAGSDGAPALFRSETVSAILAHRPTLQVSTTWNGPKDARRMNLKFVWPVIQTVSAVESIAMRIPMELSMTVPQGADATSIGEAVYQGLNLCAATLIKQSAEQGFAPT